MCRARGWALPNSAAQCAAAAVRFAACFVNCYGNALASAARRAPHQATALPGGKARMRGATVREHVRRAAVGEVPC